ncbi:MAG TPA: DUF1592 domain-containing protein [Chthoniobacteraceae bacterium]|nr:DUF1592 domain-containing protein [Chthoniobacteraceae bacterium]
MFLILTLVLCRAVSRGEDASAAANFRKNIEPLLSEFCFDCHGDGEKKGNVVFDEFKSDDALVGSHELWLGVLKNMRAGLMPPKKKPQPSAEERKRIEEWIKFEAFGIDPGAPDPGRVTVRRLNRVEYRNTIHDLMGIDFPSEVEFPPDDTGYGFDNIGDVLTVSPILLEKYLIAARTIVTEAVPIVSLVAPETKIPGDRFRSENDGDDAEGKRGNRREPIRSLSYYEEADVGTSHEVAHAGSYHVVLDLAVRGNFESDPGKCRVVFKIDDREVLQKEFGWHDFKAFAFEFDEEWNSGPHRFTLTLEPLTPVEKKINSLAIQILSLKVRGPMAEEHWNRPPNYERFFTRDDPKTPEGRRAEASEVLRRFATKAFRRPVDDRSVERLTALAESVYTQPGKTFEAGVAHAMVAVLASPRFLFRLEESAPGFESQSVADVDEYSLASRLSYFLWSTMPDDELIRLAGSGELRRNLPAQIQRMITDPRSDAMVRNFTGQWLQARDVDGIAINARVVLARDKGEEREIAARRKRIQELFAIPEPQRTPEQKEEMKQMFAQFRKRGPQLELDRDLREAMKRETEMFFTHVFREDRSVTELIDSDYTFLNEKLAGLYGIAGVSGPEMRRVALPADSPRGGVLTQGSVLVVTSNPDRTSPVKRGLFVLDNILGTPAPPPPANVPALEAAEKDFHDRDPTLREALELHREKPLCAACHARMDPIGLAFENFNALGMWREMERKQPIDTSGQLITGESFHGVRELKRILVENHRLDFYRCLTEKMLTFAIGRGLEYYDVETVDRIVRRLEAENGRFSALLNGIIESAPFQKQRTGATAIQIASP